MSVVLTPDLWVTVQQAERPNAPRPLPLESGFSLGRRYKVLGLHCASETSEAYLILCTDRTEMWFLSNQHLRIADGANYRDELAPKVRASLM